MDLFKRLSFIALLVVTQTCNANPLYDFLSHNQYALGVAHGYGQLGRSQTLTLLNGFQNRYRRDNDYQGFWLFNLSATRTVFHRNRDFFDLGIDVAGSTNLTTEGAVLQFANPQFDNLDYSYDMNHYHVNALGKWAKPFNNGLQLEATVDAGLSINRSHNYQENPRILAAVILAPFAPKNAYGFNYGLSIGISKGIQQQNRVGLLYAYRDLGPAKIGVSPQQNTDETPRVNHVSSHWLKLQWQFNA